MADQRPVLDQINLVVRDMDASVAFYRRLGVDIPDRGPRDAHHRPANVGGLDFDLDSVAFAHQWDEGWRGPAGGAGCVIGFKVASREEVDRVYADLTGAGSRAQQPPYDAFWGARYAVIEDPDGNAVGIMSASDPAFRTDPGPPPAS
jgi:catechol 2,3-dioxygenase-like lactoylglutathione lyase family enzyme